MLHRLISLLAPSRAIADRAKPGHAISAASNRFAVIAADPPWHWKTRSAKGEGRSARNHYDLMSLDDLKAMRPQIDAWAADDCVLLLWCINSMRQEPLDLIAAWGFEFKTVAFTWAKRNRKSEGWAMGLGYWSRQNTEQVLLATRGRPRRIGRDVLELIDSPRREHSRKPDEFYSRTERLLPGPYLDVFARERRPGWEAWGFEADKFISAA